MGTSLEQKIERMKQLISEIETSQQSAAIHKQNFDKQTNEVAKSVDAMIKARNPNFKTLKEFLDDCKNALPDAEKKKFEKDMMDVYEKLAHDNNDWMAFIYTELYLRGGIALVQSFRMWHSASDVLVKAMTNDVGAALAANAAKAASAAAESQLSKAFDEANKAEATSEKAMLHAQGEVKAAEKALVETQMKLAKAQGLSAAEKAALAAAETEQKVALEGVTEAAAKAAASKVAAKAMLKRGIAFVVIGLVVWGGVSLYQDHKEAADQAKLLEDVKALNASRLYAVLAERHILNMVSLPAFYSAIADARTQGNVAIINFQIDQFVKNFGVNDKGTDDKAIDAELKARDKKKGVITTDDPELDWMQEYHKKLVKKAEEDAAAAAAAAATSS